MIIHLTVFCTVLWEFYILRSGSTKSLQVLIDSKVQFFDPVHHISYLPSYV